MTSKNIYNKNDEEMYEIDKKIICLIKKRMDIVNSFEENAELDELYLKSVLNKNLEEIKLYGYENNLAMMFVEDIFKKINEYQIDKRKNIILKKEILSLNQLKIEHALETDLDEVLLLQKICFEVDISLFNDFTIEPVKSTKEEIIDEFKNKTILKVVYKDKIIGSVRGHIEKNICQITKLIVHPDFENIGIGKKLIESIENEFNKCESYEMFTRKESYKNVKIYKSIGYVPYKEELFLEKYNMIYLRKSNIV